MSNMERAADGYRILHGLFCIAGLALMVWLIWTAPDTTGDTHPSYEAENRK